MVYISLLRSFSCSFFGFVFACTFGETHTLKNINETEFESFRIVYRVTTLRLTQVKFHLLSTERAHESVNGPLQHKDTISQSIPNPVKYI